MRSNVRTRNAAMTTPRIIVRMSTEMKELGFGQSVGQIVQMAYVVEDIRAAMDLWRATIDWNGQDRIRPFA